MNKLKKTQKKIVDFFQDKPYNVNRKDALSQLGITAETLRKNLRTLDEMNVLEIAQSSGSPELVVLVNSEEDWQVYQVNGMKGKVNNKSGVNQF